MEPKGLRARRFWVVLTAALLLNAASPAFSAATAPGVQTFDPAIFTDASDLGAASVEGTAAMLTDARQVVRLAGYEQRSAAAALLEVGAIRDAAGQAAARAAASRTAVRAEARKPARPRIIVRNHLWIPALGMSRPVFSFPCWRSAPPANYVYRWGCAGRNNIYLLGHAYGVLKALHDAYLDGRLRKGMVAYYADSSGRITRFRVTAWQVVLPTQTAWAMAAQSRLSMTLQTCMGSRDQYRLDVRLVSF